MAQSTSTLSVVSNDGTVLWIPPVIINSRCDLDLYYFPFDKQQCQLIFGSWTHSAETVSCDVNMVKIVGVLTAHKHPLKCTTQIFYYLR